MVIGIGTDMVYIPDIARYMQQPEFIVHTFTKSEQRDAEQRFNRAEYFAARFAAKEAVFKAIAYRTRKKGFDLRIVETLNREDGSPYICIGEELQQYLDEAGVKKLHISITTETDYAIAFVVAEG